MQQAEPVVAEVLAVQQRLEDERQVCRAVVQWSDETIGEALAWYAGTASIDEDELVGRSASELDALLLQRLAGR